MVGWRVLGAWNVDPVHPREAQSLDLTLLQVMGKNAQAAEGLGPEDPRETTIASSGPSGWR